jgi:UDP-galactopyranose mutase
MRAAVATTSWQRTAEAIRTLIDAAAGDAAGATWAPEATPVDHLIIGGGATGLAAADYLGQWVPDLRTLLVERRSEVAGWCRSVVDQGFTFDYAGHIMFSTDPEVLRLYALLLGENVHWQNREAWVHSKDVYRAIRFKALCMACHRPC